MTLASAAWSMGRAWETVGRTLGSCKYTDSESRVRADKEYAAGGSLNWGIVQTRLEEVANALASTGQVDGQASS